MMHSRIPGHRFGSGFLIAAVVALACSLLPAQAAEAESAYDTVSFSCNTVTFTYAGFPNAPGNMVVETIYVDGAHFLTKHFSFDGPEGSDPVFVNLPKGHHKIDARAQWKTNGVRGGHDQGHTGGLHCTPEPSFTVEKLQKTSRRSAFTTARLFGARRETVLYEVLVKNTGNVPLTLSGFTDPRCDAGTVAGGPGSSPLAPGESTTYTCKHFLTPEEQALGTYENVAEVTATPPEGDGPPLTQPSNPVLIELPHNTVESSCTAVTLTFANFPNAPGNTVTELVYVDGSLLLSTSYSFDGPTGSNTIPLMLSPGHHSIDVWAKWDTNGAHGGHDQHREGGLKCTAEAEG